MKQIVWILVGFGMIISMMIGLAEAQGVAAAEREVDTLTAEAKRLTEEAERLLSQKNKIEKEINSIKKEKEELNNKAHEIAVNNPGEAENLRQHAREKEKELENLSAPYANTISQVKTVQGHLNDTNSRLNTLRQCLRLQSCRQALEAGKDPACIFDGSCR